MARTRSPNYPALSLPKAVARIREVYACQHLTPESREVVVKHMGYNSVNGRSSKSLSALIKYGLLDEEDGGFRVSDRALDIIEPESEQSKADALRAAAYSPKILADLFERYDQKPTEASLSAYLVRSGFIPSAVDALAKSFEETYDLLDGLEGDSESSSSEDNSLTPDFRNPFTAPLFDKMKPGANKPTPKAPASSGPQEIEMNCTKPVFDFESVQIVTKIDNQADLTALMGRLEAIKALLPNISPKQVAEESSVAAASAHAAAALDE